MRSLLLLLFLSIFLLGFKFREKIPYYETALVAHNMPKSLTFTCLTRAEYYYRYLQSKNIESRLVIGRHKKDITNRHAWVEYKHDNKWYVVDVSDWPSAWGWENRYYPWLLPENYYYGEFSREQIPY